MAHTNAWNVTDPPGTEQAKNIDNHIRKLRVDIGDRLADLVVDVMADPLKLKADAQDPVVDKKLLIPFTSFIARSDEKEYVLEPGRTYAFVDTGPLMATVGVPVGCTITKIELMGDVGDATQIIWNFYARSFAAGGTRPASVTAMVSLANGTINGPSAVKLSDSGVIAVLVDAAQMYYLHVECTGPIGNSFDLYGARVTYTSPSAATVR
jgi:hypothetical protein